MMKTCRQTEFHSKHWDEDDVSQFLQTVQKWYTLCGKSRMMPPDLSSDCTFRFCWANLNDESLTLFRLLHSTPLGIKQCIQHNSWIKVQISTKVLMKYQGHVQKTFPKLLNVRVYFLDPCYFLYLGAEWGSCIHVYSEVSLTRSSFKNCKYVEGGEKRCKRNSVDLNGVGVICGFLKEKNIKFLIGNWFVVFGFQLLIPKGVNVDWYISSARPALCTEMSRRDWHLAVVIVFFLFFFFLYAAEKMPMLKYNQQNQMWLCLIFSLFYLKLTFFLSRMIK